MSSSASQTFHKAVTCIVPSFQRVYAMLPSLTAPTTCIREVLSHSSIQQMSPRMGSPNSQHSQSITTFSKKTKSSRDFPGGPVVKNPPANAGDVGLIPGSGRSPERKWQPTPVCLPGKFHGQRSLAGYSPWACKESDMT